MPLTFQAESFTRAAPELAPLFLPYWEEVGTLRHQVPFEVDLERYGVLEASGALLCVTARTAARVPVGLMLALLGTHNHAMSARCAFVESWYLHPDYRGRGRTAIRLWETLVTQLRARNYPHVLLGITVEKDIHDLCTFLGMQAVERVYYTYLGGTTHGSDFYRGGARHCRRGERRGRGGRRGD